VTPHSKFPFFLLQIDKMFFINLRWGMLGATAEVGLQVRKMHPKKSALIYIV
jgi:hypothetical protein